MIRLAGNQTRTFVSPIFTHPARTPGTTFDQYAFNHNFGKTPDLVRVYEVGTRTQRVDFYISSTGSQYNDWFVDNTTSSSATINIFRIGAGAVDLYTVCYDFGVEHP